jgi:hypothetical protein
LDHQIIVNEFRRIGVIGPDTSYPGGGQKNIVWLHLVKKGLHCGLFPEIQVPGSTANEVPEAPVLKASPNGASHQALMAGHVNLDIFVHGSHHTKVFAFIIKPAQ